MCQSLFFIKLPATLLKKRLWRRCFPVNFTKFLRTPFLENTSGRLLLKRKDIPAIQSGFMNKTLKAIIKRSHDIKQGSSEAATRRILFKNVFFKILQFLQKNTYVGVSF